MLILKQIGLITAVVYFLILLFVYFQQKSFIFFPTHAQHRSTDKQISKYELSTDHVSLRGWLLNTEASPERLLIYYGGNAEDIFFTIGDFKIFSDAAILFVNYRGYGSSTGSPGEDEFFTDALSIFDDVSRKFSPKKIFLVGRSLGSGVASYVAGHRKVDGVILITPFASIESLAKKQFPFLPTTLLLKHKFRSSDYIRKYKGPCLIIYGGKDRIVPPQSTLGLIKHIPGEKEIVCIENADHNNIEGFSEFNTAIMQFIKK